MRRFLYLSLHWAISVCCGRQDMKQVSKNYQTLFFQLRQKSKSLMIFKFCGCIANPWMSVKYFLPWQITLSKITLKWNSWFFWRHFVLYWRLQFILNHSPDQHIRRYIRRWIMQESCCLSLWKAMSTNLIQISLCCRQY